MMTVVRVTNNCAVPEKVNLFIFHFSKVSEVPTSSAGIVAPVVSQSMITSLDGNVDMQDTQTAPVAMNKIKINITKNVAVKSTTATTTTTTSSTDDGLLMPIEVITGMGQQSLSGAAMIDDRLPSSSATAATMEPPPPPIQMSFEYKETMRNRVFEVVPKNVNGFETSGLCSIM